MPTKNTSINAGRLRDGGTRLTLSFADDASPHPGCITVDMAASGVTRVLFAENVERAMNGDITARVPAAPFDAADVQALKRVLRRGYEHAMTAAGFTLSADDKEIPSIPTSRKHAEAPREGA